MANRPERRQYEHLNDEATSRRPHLGLGRDGRDNYQAFGVAAEHSGRRLAKSTYLPAELPALLADRGPQQVGVSLDGRGRITWGELDRGG